MENRFLCRAQDLPAWNSGEFRPAVGLTHEYSHRILACCYGGVVDDRTVERCPGDVFCLG
jgi:hypothetical protein